MGWSAVSASLWMTSNCRQQSMCWRAVMLFRGTWAGWRNGLTGTSPSSAKANASSCLWDGITLCKDGLETNCLGSNAAERDPRGLVNSNLSMSQQCALTQQRKSPASLGCMDKSVASRSGKDPSPLFGICETDCGASCPVLGSPEQEGCWVMAIKWGGQGAIAHGIRHEAKRPGSTQP